MTPEEFSEASGVTRSNVSRFETVLDAFEELWRKGHPQEQKQPT
jgi:hypothetical protein